MDLNNLMKRLHDVLRENHIVGLNAMMDICYLLGVKGLEKHICKTPEPGKIDLLNPDHYTEDMHEILNDVPFSKWSKFDEYDLYDHVFTVFHDILAVHPITSNMYSGVNLHCEHQSTIKIMVEALDRFDFDSINTDFIGDTYENFLANLTGGKTLGQFFTSKKVVKFIISEMQIESNSSVYDPCCGTGGFLIESWKHDKTLTIAGCDVSKETLIMGNVNMLINTASLLNNNDEVIINNKDTLKTQDVKKYDYILTNPPFGLTTKYEELRKAYSQDINTFKLLFPHKTTDSGILFLQSVLYKMKKGLAIILPSGREFSNRIASKIKMRRNLLENYNLQKIVSLTGKVFAYTSVKTSIMFWTPLNTNQEKTEQFEFYEYNTDTETKTFIKTITRANLIENSYSFIASDYIEDNTVYSNTVEIKRLSEIADIIPGKALSKKNFVSGKYSVIGGGKSVIGKHNEYNTEANTILISRKGTAGLISIYSEKIYITGDCAAIKVKETYNNVYVYTYLKHIQEKIQKLGTGIAQPGITLDKIQNIKIPIPHESQITTINALCESNFNLLTTNETWIKQQQQQINLYISSMINSFISNTESKRLSEIADISPGKALTKKNIVPGKYSVIGGGKSAINKHNSYNTEANTILISRMGSAGWVSIYPEKIYITEHCVSVKVKENYNNVYVYTYLKYIQEKIQKLATGIAQPGITLDKIRKIKVCLPDTKTQNSIVNLLTLEKKLISDCQKMVEDNKQQVKEVLDTFIICDE